MSYHRTTIKTFTTSYHYTKLKLRSRNRTKSVALRNITTANYTDTRKTVAVINQDASNAGKITSRKIVSKTATVPPNAPYAVGTTLPTLRDVQYIRQLPKNLHQKFLQLSAQDAKLTPQQNLTQKPSNNNKTHIQKN